MKSKPLFCLALILSGILFGCSSARHQPSVELTWPDKASRGLAWARPMENIGIVEERFKSASTKPLGSETDITAIDQAIKTSHPAWNLQVEELRWLSPSLAMARVRAPEAEYFYVVEKREGQWSVLTYYLRWIS